jgi:hypothetical protein
VSLQKDESLVVGFCLFEDDGQHPRYNWVAFERDNLWPSKWIAYTIDPADDFDDRDKDLVRDASMDWFTDQRVSLGPPLHYLGSDPGGTLRHRHYEWERLRKGSDEYKKKGPDPTGQWPTVRAVASGDVITFSIEINYKSHDLYRLTGEYHSPFFPPPLVEERASLDERLQYGAVKLRSASTPSEETLRRAAHYGADVLRRRGESLHGPEVLRKERLGDNNHLVLFVRNSRTAEVSWLGVSSAGDKGLLITAQGQGGQCVHPQLVEEPALPAPWLAPPKVAQGGPASAFPFFLGGVDGSHLVEIWLAHKQLTDGRFAFPPTPLFDVQYLFIRPQ